MSRALRNSGGISSTPGALSSRSFLTALATSVLDIGESNSGSLGPASPLEGISVRLRRYSLHQSTTSLVAVSSIPSPLHTGPEPFRSRPEVVLHGSICTHSAWDFFFLHFIFVYIGLLHAAPVFLEQFSEFFEPAWFSAHLADIKGDFSPATFGSWTTITNRVVLDFVCSVLLMPQPLTQPMYYARRQKAVAAMQMHSVYFPDNAFCSFNSTVLLLCCCDHGEKCAVQTVEIKPKYNTMSGRIIIHGWTESSTNRKWWKINKQVVNKQKK